MPPTINLGLHLGLDGTETKDAADAPSSGAAGNFRKFNNYNNLAVLLNGTTTPKVNQSPVDLSVASAAGATTTFDLTAAPDAKDVNDTIDLTGDKLVAILIKMLSGNNASGVIVRGSAATPYEIFGHAGGEITLYPGQGIVQSFIDADTALAAVAAGVKNIDFVGTAGDGWECIAYFQTP